MLKKDLEQELRVEREYSADLAAFLEKTVFSKIIWKRISMTLVGTMMGMVLLLSYASTVLNKQVSSLERRVKLIVETPVELTPEEYIRNENFQWDADTMVAIAICESDVNWEKINPEAVNFNIHTDGTISVDRGVFAINSKYHPDLSPSDAFDPIKNIDYAYGMWLESGTGPWYAKFSECYEEIR